jgi:putative chitinase
MTIDAKAMQARLGVPADGEIGPATLGALFAAMGAGPERASELGLGAAVHLRRYAILDTGLRLAHFMGQCAHESAGFRYMEEIASGEAYEGRDDLGNVHPGDGRRYKGRGPIQLTGRANYREFGRELGIDLEAHPEIASIPSIGVLTASKYWSDRGLNALADADDIVAITKRINGGTRGMVDRVARTNQARRIVFG